MTDKELRRLRRGELLEMLLEQSKENQELQEQNEGLQKQIEELQEKLNDRKIMLDEAGTIAEAAFQLNGVYEAVQAASEQYLENIKVLSDNVEERCAKKEAETEAYLKKLIEQTKKKCAEMEKDTDAKCEEKEKETEESCRQLREQTEQEVEKKWNELSEKLETFYKTHGELRAMLNMSAETKSE